MSRELRRAIIAFACGAAFAAGLTIAGMERPMVILNAFTLSSSFDPRMPVMFLVSIAVHAPLAAWIRRRRAPACTPRARGDAPLFDTPFLFGSVLFGIGWGISGVCPGPAFTAALVGTPYVTTFMAGLVAGIVLHHVIRERPRPAASALLHIIKE